MAARRDSRTHISVRQNDTLLELENFKRKFLLVNKQIAKANSTLSVRVEELNVQVSTLHAENLRLRASEIVLVNQLKRERDKSRRVMAQADAATANLVKHLNSLRISFGASATNAGELQSPTVPAPESPPASSAPRARRPRKSEAPPPRLSKVPDVPHINEEDGVSTPSSTPTKESSTFKSTTTPNPVPSVIPHINLSAQQDTTKRRPSRRQSGILAPMSARPASPVMGSPLTIEVDSDGEVEDLVVRETDLDADKDGDEADTFVEQRNRGKSREQPRTEEKPISLRDVTNSPPPRQSHSASPTDRADMEIIVATRTSLLSPPPLPPSVSTANAQPSSARLIAARGISPDPASGSQPESEETGGRERRVRKSVNYAEPKLNTKMRKPDPPIHLTTPAAKSTTTSRSSASAARRKKAASTPTPPPDFLSDHSHPYPFTDDQAGTGDEADVERDHPFSSFSTTTRRRSLGSSSVIRERVDSERRQSIAV